MFRQRVCHVVAPFTFLISISSPLTFSRNHNWLSSACLTFPIPLLPINHASVYVFNVFGRTVFKSLSTMGHELCFFWQIPWWWFDCRAGVQAQRPIPRLTWMKTNPSTSGLATNSILFGWFFAISSEKCFFYKQNQGLHPVVFGGVLGPRCLAWHTWRCPWFSVAPKARHEPLTGAMSALKGSQTESLELLVETEGKCISPMRGLWYALQAN